MNYNMDCYSKEEGRAYIEWKLKKAGCTDPVFDDQMCIRDRLHQYGFHGEPGCYLTALPHMFAKQSGIAVIRVTVFEKTEK